MTRTPTALIRTALLAGVALAAGLALDPSHARTASEGSTRLVLDQRDGKDVFVDAPPRGTVAPTLGDTYVTSNHLLDPTTGQRIGRTHQECVVTQVMRDPLDAVADCTAVLVTPDGSFTLQAAWLFSATTQELAVTGGTGSYAAATGVATWTSGKGDASTWTLELSS